jgi:hypothetical protein
MATNATAALQMSATGGIDEKLTAKPETSIFNYSYKQISQFAKDTEYFHYKEVTDFSRLVTLQIPYKGELMHSVYLYFKLPSLNLPTGSTYVGWTNSIGFAMIEYIEFRIGETIIDKHYTVPMEVMDYLVNNGSKSLAHDKTVGRYDNVNVLPLNAQGTQDIYIPLQFWFTKKLSMSLPLLCIDLPVKIMVKIRDFQDLVTYDGNIAPDPVTFLDSGVLIDYYIINKDEKEEFIAEEQQYLIDQWKLDTFEISALTMNKKFRLDFKLAIKELIFVIVETESEVNNDYFNYGRRDPLFRGGEFITSCSLYFDNKERFYKIPESYLRTVVPQKYHSFAGDRNIYVISFAEFPEENQPTGTANFSRYDAIDLELEFVQNIPSCKLYILAVSYNNIIFNKKNHSAVLEYIQ